MPQYGFNFLWLYSVGRAGTRTGPDCRKLDFLCETGFDFVRLPTDYRFWTRDFQYQQMDEDVLGCLDAMIAACRERGLHVCLNLHRAPGFCINRPELERHRLWCDTEAQDGFVFQWETFARRYRDISSEDLSFDLVNEPSGTEDERSGHDAVIRRTVSAVRAIDPDREIVIDGWQGGYWPLPELADLDVIQSGRGYQPFWLTHYKAPWCKGTQDLDVPEYPEEQGEGGPWNRNWLKSAVYGPWRDLESRGVRVHIGEFGCYNETPNDVALRWYADVLSVFREFGWGYSLWNFEGPFGIINHGRPGAKYESWRGFQVDRELLDLLLENRVPQVTF